MSANRRFDWSKTFVILVSHWLSSACHFLRSYNRWIFVSYDSVLNHFWLIYSLPRVPTESHGPDSINNKILKDLAQPLSPPLTDLFNFSLEKGKSSGNKPTLHPSLKKTIFRNCLTIEQFLFLVLLVRFSKKLFINTSSTFFQENHIINALQSGFLPGDSTVNQITDLYNTFCQALDEGKEVRAIFWDISKAFGRVWHKGLLYKLSSVGISGPLLRWFTDYLDKRTQRVVLPGTALSWTSIKAGVPQGSILGPLLFLLYINDIVENIHSSIRLFADDTSLYIIVDDPIDSANQLNNDLQTIHLWAKTWLVTFNPTKSESVIFSWKRNKPYHPPVFMNQTEIKEVTSHKHLAQTIALGTSTSIILNPRHGPEETSRESSNSNLIGALFRPSISHLLDQ